MSHVDLERYIDDPNHRETVPVSTAVEAFLDRIELRQAELNCFISVQADSALEHARLVDAADRRTLPLAGVVLAVKDNTDVAGVPSTSGAELYRHYLPDQDACVVARLRAAGAVVIGKTSLHELAYGGTNDNAHFGPVRNPWDPTRIPGGSSGGSGVAVAADLCTAALGTDTGGSVRIPAAFNGVSGLRTTLGSVSNRGVRPISPTFDTVGPMARSVADIARLTAVMAGFDPHDPWAVDHPAPGGLLAAAATSDLRGRRIGIPRGYFYDDLDAEVASRVEGALDQLRDLGAELVELEISGSEEANADATLIIRAEAYARYSGELHATPMLIGADVRQRLWLGSEITGGHVAAAGMRMAEWRNGVQNTLRSVDAIVVPTVRIPPSVIAGVTDMTRTTASGTALTYPFSGAQVPGLSVPCGFTADRLPVGLQIVAAPWCESAVVAIGAAYQSVTAHHLARPLWGA
jgi:aspartyl-tRNA(Asn)/glutamyl-tRNA(Gln) amidotransferase subunit A